CLPWRRLADFWAVLCYSADAPDLNDTTRFILPPAVEDTAALVQAPPKAECPDIKTAVRRAVQGDNTAAKGKRHIILVNQSEAGVQRTGYEQLLSTVKQSRA